MMALGEGRVDDALRLLSENLMIIAELDEPAAVPANFVRIAAALAISGRGRPAAIIMAHAESSLSELGFRPRWIDAILAEIAETLQARLDADDLTAALRQGATISRADALALAREELAAALG